MCSLYTNRTSQKICNTAINKEYVTNVCCIKKPKIRVFKFSLVTEH